MRKKQKRYGVYAGVVFLAVFVLYAFSLGLWRVYWEQKCLKVGFLGADVSYKYEVYCQDGNKSIRIKP